MTRDGNETLQTSRLRVLLLALALAIAAVVAACGGHDDASSSGPPDVTPGPRVRFSSVSLLVGGQDRMKIDTRVFDIIANGIDWMEVQQRILPAEELEVVMVYQEDRALSVGIRSNPPDPAKVEALWKDMGLPNRKRPLYVTSLAETPNPLFDYWLRQKLMELGFELTKDRGKARESLMFTIAR